MKTPAVSVALGVAGVFLVALFAAAAVTREQPAVSRLFVAGSSNQILAPVSSAPILYLNGKTKPSRPLKPGIYQTRPYAIILIVPQRGIDDGCLAAGIGMSGDSKMPVIHPNLQAVPKAPAKK
jgi:hypothetical protein